MVLRFYCIVLMFKTLLFDRIIRLSPRESANNVLSRLQNSRFFFSKSVKKSVKRGVRVLSAKLACLTRARKACEAREKKPSISIASP